MLQLKWNERNGHGPARMSPSGRKTKGKKYEEKIAKDLHDFLMENNPEYQVLFEQVGNPRMAPSRDTSSGTFKGSFGDIELNVAYKFFPFSVECKHWKSLDLSINSLLSAKIKQLEGFWHDQALPNALKSGLLPVVVFKANRTEDFVFYDKGKIPIIPTQRLIKIDNWILCLFQDFIKKVNKEVIAKNPPFDKLGDT